MNTIAGTSTLEPPAINEPVINTIAQPQPPQQIKQQLPNEGVSATATRWIFTPIRALRGFDALAFGCEEIEANKFFPLRGVNYPLRYHNGQTYSVVNRTSQEQIADIKSIAAGEPKKNTVNLLELDKLDNETEQIRILTFLSNPRMCSKYPHQLKNLCATCQRDYLVEIADRIDTKFGDERLRVAAMATWTVLYDALETDIQEAGLRINNALEAIDDKKSGKTKLEEQEVADILNTHRVMPRFRTTTDNSAALETIANRLTNGHGLSKADVAQMIADSNKEKDEEIERLKAQIPQPEAVVKCGDTGGLNAQNEPCGNLGKYDGRCANHRVEEQKQGETNER